ncbi:MAG: hypothetical protein OEN23_15875 [Paracoccaceae bacterium]|nr:hypothetical protein [Paracoccaceae bacterium]
MTSHIMPLPEHTAKGPAFMGLKFKVPPFGKWIAVARERSRLGRLTDAQLRDMGIDPKAAGHEAARPFWDLPAGR